MYGTISKSSCYILHDGSEGLDGNGISPNARNETEKISTGIISVGCETTENHQLRNGTGAYGIAIWAMGQCIIAHRDQNFAAA